MLQNLTKIKLRKSTPMKEIQQLFTHNKEMATTKLAELEKMPDPQYRYIIAITPRSGSSYLSDVMLHTEKLGRPGEFLNQAIIPNVLKSIPGRNPDEYLRNVLRLRKTPNNVAGLKASWYQFRNFKECVKDKNAFLDFKYIHLIRRDAIAQAVSLYRATASNVFHSNIKHSDDAINKLNELNYNYEEIKKWYVHIMQQEQGWQQFFDEQNIFPLNIFYEDIEADILGVLKRIARYMQLDANTISLPPKNSVFKKISDARSLEWTQRFSLEYTLHNQQPLHTLSTPLEKSVFDIDYQNEINSDIIPLFTYHGFNKVNLPKVPIIDTLSRHFVSVNDAFISSAIFNEDKTLLGGIYENKQLINNATYRGIALYTQKNPLTINDNAIKNATIIQGQSVYLGWLWDYHSHLLFESLSRFWILNNIDVQNTTFIFHPIGSSASVANILTTELVQAIFNCFNIKTTQIVLAKTDLIAEKLIIPSPLLLINISADIFQQAIYQRLKLYLLQLARSTPAELSRKLYLIPAKKEPNQAILESILETQGFEMLNIDSLPIYEQVKLISEAGVIISASASAYLAVFAAKNAKIIIFDNNPSAGQLIINALAQVETHFIASALLRNESELKLLLIDLQILVNTPHQAQITYDNIPSTLNNLATQEQQWINYFSAVLVKHQLPAVIKNAAATEDKPELAIILQAMQKNDVLLVEKTLRQLTETLANTYEANIGKRWLAAKAIAANNIALAKEFYTPLTMNLSINQVLLLPTLTEIDLKNTLKAQPQWTELVLVLAYFYWSKARYEEAKNTLTDIVFNRDEDAIYHIGCEIYCDSLLRLKEPKKLIALEKNSYLTLIEKICKNSLRVSQDYRYPFFYLGAVSFRRYVKNSSATHLKTALEFFNQAKTRPESLAYNSQGCSSVIDPADVALFTPVADTAFNHEVIFDEENVYQQATPQSVLFFACDASYLYKYAFLLIASLARFNEKRLCHIHIVNPDASSGEIIIKLRRQFTALQFNISMEFFTLKHQKAYYASVRFIRAQQLLTLYQCPLLIVDVDLILEVPMQTINDFVGAADVGLLLHNQTAILPWVAVQACVVYLNNTEKTQQFLELLANVLLARLFDDNEETLWFIDQNALFSVVRFMGNTLSVCNLLNHSPRVYDMPKGMNKRSFTRSKLAEFGFNDSFINSLIE